MVHFAIVGLGPISQFFANVLKLFNSWTGNFTLSVILLTIAFRIVVLPLSIKQTKSMMAMQKLQPQLKEIQKKYKEDREKQGQEMMKLYKENKVSPLGGCLPLLIQLPILFALFDVLHNTTKYIQWTTSYSFLGIKNVIATGSTMWKGGTIKYFDAVKKMVDTDAYSGHEYWQVILLIVLTIVTGYISAKMMTTDPRQSKMMALMPVVFGVFAWILPAGVTIYIITTNVLTMLQQWIQLEKQGFYKERREERGKSGEPTGFIERLKINAGDTTQKALVALHVRPEAKPAPKKGGTKKGAQPARGASKQGGKAPVKAPAGKAQASNYKKPEGEQAGKAEKSEPKGSNAGSAAPEKAESKGGRESSQEKPGPQKKKQESKNYPAKKKGAGKK